MDLTSFFALLFFFALSSASTPLTLSSFTTARPDTSRECCKREMLASFSFLPPISSFDKRIRSFSSNRSAPPDIQREDSKRERLERHALKSEQDEREHGANSQRQPKNFICQFIVCILCLAAISPYNVSSRLATRSTYDYSYPRPEYSKEDNKGKEKMEDQDFLDDIDDLLYDIDVDGEAYVLFKGFIIFFTLSFLPFLFLFPFPFPLNILDKLHRFLRLTKTFRRSFTTKG